MSTFVHRRGLCRCNDADSGHFVIVQMKNWTREETIVAFNLYCKIPFNRSRKTHPLVVKYANVLGRSPSALNMKIGNIGRLDPDLKAQGIVGLGHGAKMEEEVWRDFYGDPERLAFESERLLSEFAHQSIERSAGVKTDDLPEGIERERLVRQRVNQSFFRSTVMSSYNFHCCISGVAVPELLEACHIVDWADDVSNRTNPKNGLCLNSFFHKAYDKYLLAITPDLTIEVSEELLQTTSDNAFQTYLKGLSGRAIVRPDKFLPQRELLEIHYSKYKERSHVRVLD